MPISFEIPLKLRGRLVEVMQAAVAETFQVVFGIDVHSSSSPICAPSEKEHLVCMVRLVQSNLIFNVFFNFSHDLLRPIVAQYYPEEASANPNAFADAGCEIANIVCCNLKAFLNSHGYSLDMQIPFVETEADNPEDERSVSLYFCGENKGFSINIQMTGQEAAFA